jgi:signal peptidase II
MVEARTMALTKALPWYALAGAALLVDQVTKFATAFYMVYGAQIRITSFFNLVHVRNEGAAFSFLADAGGWQRYLFIALALGISAYLALMLRQGLARLEAAGIALILGGALGNVTDRILRGSVVDFLDFHYRNAHWPAFNLADVSIFLGVACVIGAALMAKNTSAPDQTA